MFPIDFTYNNGQGRLKSDTTSLAGKDAEWYRTFPPDTFLGAFDIALNSLNPVTQQDFNEIATIRRKLAIARYLNHDVTLEWAGDIVTARLPRIGVGKVGHCDFEEIDGRFWIVGIETEANYRRRGIGTTLIYAGIAKYGNVYASSATKQKHEEHDENDTRWLTDEGAALVRTCISRGIMRPEHYLSPFPEESNYEFEDDDN